MKSNYIYYKTEEPLEFEQICKIVVKYKKFWEVEEYCCDNMNCDNMIVTLVNKKNNDMKIEINDDEIAFNYFDTKEALAKYEEIMNIIEMSDSNED